MNRLDQYLQAATRENTRKSYASALRHYEVEWQGLLPATADNIARYLADHAETLSINTLKQRLTALSQWHVEQGFPDPTKAPLVKQVFRGIKAVHPAQEKQAKPLQLLELEQVVNYLDQDIAIQQAQGNFVQEMRLKRDKSLLLLGFWRGFRGDELTRLEVENIQVSPQEGMQCFLPYSKTDRQFQGQTFRVPALARLCSVQAYTDWIEISGLTEGFVYRGIHRYGKLSDQGLHIDSLLPLLRKIFTQAQIATPESYSTHSLRRGFANWASQSGWDVKTLMQYVGWKNVNSALRYVEAANPFQGFSKNWLESKNDG
ncbi:site-specific integrase [Acinetobacter sp. ANC 5383]